MHNQMADFMRGMQLHNGANSSNFPITDKMGKLEANPARILM
jgi:hypothetical protein